MSYLLVYLLIAVLYFQTLPWFNQYLTKIINFWSPVQFQIFPLDIIVFLIIIIAILKRGIPLRGLLKKSNLEHLALVYLFLGLVAILIGISRQETNLFYDFRLYFYFLLVPALSVIINTQKKLYRTIKFLILINALVAGYVFITEFILKGFKFGYLPINRAMNLYCLVIMLALLFYIKRDLFLKFSTYLFLPLSFLVMLVDNSRKQYLGFIVALAMILFLAKKYILKKKIFFAIPLVILLIFVFLISTQSFDIFSQSYERAIYLRIHHDPSIIFRLYAIEFTLKEIIGYPLFGLGTGAHQDFNERLIANKPELVEYAGISPHNIYLSILITGGFIGLLFFLYLIITLLKRNWLAYKKSHNFLKFLSLGIFVGPFSFLVSMFFEGLTINTITAIWFFGGLCLVSYNIYFERSEKQGSRGARSLFRRK